MSWAKLTYERTMCVYKEFLGDFIVKANSNVDLKIKEVLVRSEIQKRDFTKRQMNILSSIIALSYMLGKEAAILKPSDLSLTGVPLKKVQEEITKLLGMNVIKWDKDFNEFSITDTREWNAPYHKFYDDKRSQELFFINLRHAGIDVEVIVKKKKEMGF